MKLSRVVFEGFRQLDGPIQLDKSALRLEEMQER